MALNNQATGLLVGPLKSRAQRLREAGNERGRGKGERQGSVAGPSGMKDPLPPLPPRTSRRISGAC